MHLFSAMSNVLGKGPGVSLAAEAGLSRVALVSSLAAVALLWFLPLDARHLFHADEGRYAEIAREMLVSGDWVTIRYNGLKYFEKPPLHLWMTTIAYKAFGVGDWQARLWVAISGFMGMLVSMLAAQRWFGARVAILTGLVLLAAPLWNIGGHFNSLDMSVSGALACVLAFLLIAQHPSASPSGRRIWMHAAWGSMAVAVLTKGLIGIVLPGLALVVYTLVTRDWALWRRLSIAGGAIVFALIAIPWFVLVSLRNPEFPQFFFIHEHFQRYTSSVHRRSAPVWYFVPVLFVGFLPWWGLARRTSSVVCEDSGRKGFRPLVFLSAWAVTIFIFFSLSGSKLPGYVMPMLPALAMLAAVALDRLDGRPWGRQVNFMLVLAAVAFVAGPLVGRMSAETANEAYRQYMHWIIAGCGVAVAGLAAARWINTRGALLASIATASLSLHAATSLVIAGHGALDRPGSGIDLVPAINAVLKPDTPIYFVRFFDHTLPFYLRRTVTPVETADELEFGTRQEPRKWIPTYAAFRRTWTEGPHALAIMSPSTYETLRQDGLMMVPVARDMRRVVVANFRRTDP
ncbi:MAG TPA: glycosyltransferase family 39 protein [Burkholderiaceae bacterium]|nr:glycosyltransferase family 39 protein [Burkholderiaceae bacterium]